MDAKFYGNLYKVKDDTRLWAKLLRLRLKCVAGRLVNLAGIPGLVRNCQYEGTIADARIHVRVGELFTVVTVNGLDIYFNRLSGSIDGIGLMPREEPRRKG